VRGKKILVIDDDADMRTLLSILFSRAGAEVHLAADGREGLGQFGVCRPDLVLLDIMMPVLDGWETCRLLRRLSGVPIIFLTATNQEDAIVRGLDCGAVDYITKPFSSKVLLARARAALRTTDVGSRERQVTFYDDGYLTIDLNARRVLVEGEPVRLTDTQYRLLAYLLGNAGRVLTYEQILEHVWGWECQGSVDYVHVYVWHLRQKLEQNPRRPRYLLTEHGVGCRFDVHERRPQGQAA
jgi:two-component system KDP operon response regulator KdpE